jgi:hypothetical protein
VAIEPAVIVEFQEQLLAWQSKQDERENALLTREHGVVEAMHALGRAHIECDIAHD